MARRASGEGTVRRREDGRWEARLRLGNGQRESVFAKTQREVAAKLRALHAEQDAGLRLGGRGETLAAYLTRWLEQSDPRTPTAGLRKLSYTTWSSYSARVRRHVLPTIGKVPIGKLTPLHVRKMLAAISDGLSPTTVAMVRDTLSTAMRRAVRDRLIPYNPVEAVDGITRARPRTYLLSPDQARALLTHASTDPLEALYVLALHAGLRQSELLGLKWSDVDEEHATVSIQRALVRVTRGGLQDAEPKTPASRATVPLSARAVAALRRRRIVTQVEQRLKAGLAWDERGYIFTTELGTPISASNMLRRSFYPLCARAGIPTRRQTDGTQGLRFHDLRHACGSLLVAQGVSPKLVQTILRHSKISTTMDLYVHAYDDGLRGAVATLDAALSV